MFKLPKAFRAFFRPVEETVKFLREPEEEIKKRKEYIRSELSKVSPILTRAGEKVKVKLPETLEAPEGGGLFADMFQAQREKMELGRKVTGAIANLPSQTISSYGKTAGIIGRGEKVGLTEVLDISDFIPGIGWFGLGGLKNVGRRGLKEVTETVAEKAGKEVGEKMFKPTAEQIAEAEAKALAEARKFVKTGMVETAATKAGTNLNWITKELKATKEGTWELPKVYPKSHGLAGQPIDWDVVARDLGYSGETVEPSKGVQVLSDFYDDLVLLKGKDPVATKGVIKTMTPQRANRLKTMAQALGLDKEYYKITGDTWVEKGTIPSYKNLKPYMTSEAVEAAPSAKTLGKISAREEVAKTAEVSKFFDDWQGAIRAKTISPTQAVNKGFKTIRQATDDAIKTNLKEKLGDIRWFDHLLTPFRTPGSVFKRLGIHIEAWLPVRRGQDMADRDIATGYKLMNNWWNQLKGNKKDASKRIFQFLDGKEVQLSEIETKVASEMRSYLEIWANTLGLPQDRRITNYITHIFKNDKGLSEELLNILQWDIPHGVFDPYLKQRYGAAGYIEDAFKAIDAYTRRSARYANLDKPISNLAEYAKNMPEFASNYIVKTLGYISGRPDRMESWMNTFMKSIVGDRLGPRPFVRLQHAITGQVFRSTLGLNIGAALRNLTQGVNTFAELGVRRTVQGYMDLVTKGTKELDEIGLLQEMIHASYDKTPMRTLLQKVDKKLYVFFDIAEKINRGAAYYGAKAKALDEGIRPEAAIEYAREIVRKTQFGYGKVDTPAFLRSPVMKIFAQYSTYPIKQAEFLASLVKDRRYGAVARYTLGSLGVFYSVGKLLGLKPSDMANIFPGLGPVPDVLKEIPASLRGDEQAQERLKRSLWLVAPAGSQISKTTTALKGIGKGEYRTKPSKTYPAGKIQFRAPKTTAGKIQSLLFGKWVSPEGKEYIKKIREKNPTVFQEIFGKITGNIDWDKFFKREQTVVLPTRTGFPTKKVGGTKSVTGTKKVGERY